MKIFDPLVVGIKHEKQRLPPVMLIWSILVISLSIIDIILMSLLVRDYRSCKDITSWVFCFLINGIAMTLAARGYLLWLLNVGAACVMLTLGIKVSATLNLSLNVNGIITVMFVFRCTEKKLYRNLCKFNIHYVI